MITNNPALAVTNLRVEYGSVLLGLGERLPRLSWIITGPSGVAQSAYHVTAGTSHDATDIWDSGRVDSDRSVFVPWAGRPLQSRQRIFWRVRVWNQNGNASPWSDIASFEMGLLDPADWNAQWISADVHGGPHTTAPCPLFRRAFQLDQPVQSARLYASALGLYEARINGQPVGNDALAPGWTDYRKRVRYQTHDVTNLLHPGENVIGAELGDGWWSGHVGWSPRQRYGLRPAFLAQLEITLHDGTQLVIATDRSWKSATGPRFESDLIMGESYDARLQRTGWDSPGFDDSMWLPSEIQDHPQIALEAPIGPSIKPVKQIAPAREPKKIGNSWLVDFGQNLVGRMRIRVNGELGRTITLLHAEILDEKGKPYYANLRKARATDRYTLKGGQPETYEPKFTFHGFRYLELQGWPGQLRSEDVAAVVLHSDYEFTGSFECSEPLVNQLQHNIQWGWRGNSLDVPTDCPQRNERLGWTGDAQVFVRTAAFNADVNAFFAKWQQDLADSQTPDGCIPSVAPDFNFASPDGGPAWADAVIICPWTMYQCYGDERILHRHYPSMQRFIASLQESAIDGVRCHPDWTGFKGYGDWLALDGSDKCDGATPKDLIGTAFFAHSAKLISRIAAVLQKHDDARHYHALFERLRDVFRRRFVTPDGLVVGQTQTAYLLALHFDLLEPQHRAHAIDAIVRDIQARGTHLSTGFVGTPYLPHVLTQAGRADVAYQLLLQKSWPGWLYAVTQGATTIWERWDGWTADKGFQDPSMNSFNHYAYGAVGAWLYQCVAGLDLDDENGAGYRRLIVRPHVGPGIAHARATLRTPYGLASSAWQLHDQTLTLNVTVPGNCSAKIFLANQEPQTVPAGNWHFHTTP